MNQLQQTINSREVAKMVSREHNEVLKDTRKIMEHLAAGKIPFSDYFIETTYLDTNKRERPCFDFTKKGCELYSTRMTGAKGTQFAVAYIEKFNQMENHIKQQLPATYKEALLHLVEQVEINEKLEERALVAEQINMELRPKATYYDLVLQNESLVSITEISKDYGWSAKKMNEFLHQLSIQFKQGKTWLLYQKYADKGYTQSKTSVVNGGKTTVMHTYWTQKGRLFIYDLLKKHNTLPIIEREKKSA